MHRSIDVAVRRVVLHVQDVIHTMRDHSASSGQNTREEKYLLGGISLHQVFGSENEDIDPLKGQYRPLPVLFKYLPYTCVPFKNGTSINIDVYHAV